MFHVKPGAVFFTFVPYNVSRGTIHINGRSRTPAPTNSTQVTDNTAKLLNHKIWYSSINNLPKLPIYINNSLFRAMVQAYHKPTEKAVGFGCREMPSRHTRQRKPPYFVRNTAVCVCLCITADSFLSLNRGGDRWQGCASPYRSARCAVPSARYPRWEPREWSAPARL